MRCSHSVHQKREGKTATYRIYIAGLCFVFLTCIAGSCPRVKMQHEMARDAMNEMRMLRMTIDALPENAAKSAGPLISQTMYGLEQVVARSQGAGEAVIGQFFIELRTTLQTAREEMARASEELVEAQNAASDRTLDKTDRIIQRGISSLDSTLLNTIRELDIMTDNKMELLDDLISRNEEKFFRDLDRFAVSTIDLVDQMMQKRINETFVRLDASVDRMLEELDTLVGKTVDRVYYRGRVVIKDLIDSTIFLVSKLVIVVVALLLLILMIIRIMDRKLPMRSGRALVATLFLLALVVLAVWNTPLAAVFGYVTEEELFTMAEKNYATIEATFHAPLDDPHGFIELCWDTIEILVRCDLYTAEENITRKAAYASRIDNINYLLDQLPSR